MNSTKVKLKDNFTSDSFIKRKELNFEFDNFLFSQIRNCKFLKVNKQIKNTSLVLDDSFINKDLIIEEKLNKPEINDKNKPNNMNKITNEKAEVNKTEFKKFEKVSFINKYNMNKSESNINNRNKFSASKNNSFMNSTAASNDIQIELDNTCLKNIRIIDNRIVNNSDSFSRLKDNKMSNDDKDKDKNFNKNFFDK